MRFLIIILCASLLYGFRCSPTNSKLKCRIEDSIFLSQDELLESLKGNWRYRTSILNDSCFSLSNNAELPTTIRFSKTDLADQPHQELLMQSPNNLSCEFSLDDSKIDDFIVDIDSGTGSSLAVLRCYGKIYKLRYYLTQINGHTMTLRDERIYRSSGNGLRNINHIYERE